MLDWVIVGGGPHGVHLAIRLIGEAGVDAQRIRIVDPAPRLLDTWHRCTGNTGMTHLRSPGVHQLDIDPFSLLRFATERAHLRNTAGELFARPYNRPAVDLFTAHCDHLIERYQLDAVHLQQRATGITFGCDGVRVETERGSLRSRRVLLALGASEQPRWPAWSRALPTGSVHHVFEPGFVLETADWPNRTAVIGAGITGAQVALRLAGAGRKVFLVARHDLRQHAFDSDPGWVGPKNMLQFSRTPDPTERRRMIHRARHLGSLPPEVHRLLRRAIQEERIHLVQGEVHDALPDLRLVLHDRTLNVDAVLLATGFETRRPGGAWIDTLIDATSLPCAACGFPLVDPHLRWHPRVFVSGPLAELEVGPVARNLIGARRSAERILPVARQRP